MIRYLGFVVGMLIIGSAFADEVPDLSHRPELKELAGVWVGGDGPHKFLRVELDEGGHGIAVGAVDTKKVEFVIENLETKAGLSWTGKFRALNGGRDFYVTSSTFASLMYLNVTDGEVNWRREFMLRRVDALEADIASTAKQATVVRRRLQDSR